MSGRWMMVYGGLLAAAAAGTWLQADAKPPPSTSVRPEPGRFYAVDLSGAHPAIDIEFDGDSRYELIVSSLGDEGRTYPVHLAAQSRRRVELFPAVPVPPLVPGNIASFQTTPFPMVRACDATDQTLVDKPRGTAERRFFLHVTADRLEDERGYVPVTGFLAGEGDQVRVYLDRQTSPAELAPGLIDELIRLLDREIIPRSREIVGEHADIDGDGKLAVLLTEWLGRLRGGTTSLNGFVRSSDFQADVDLPFGIHADVIYLNATLQPGPALKTLLAHEYTHAVCFSRRLARAGEVEPPSVEEDWLNEAIAHVSEKLHGGDWSNLDRRIAVFLAAPQKAPLVVRDYYRAGLWRDPGCRGATFLFLRFCADRFGDRILSDLVNSPAAGRRNLERATETRFAELFRHWAISLAEGNMASAPPYGRLGGIALAGPARMAWAVGTEPCRLDLCGTATAFIDLTGTGRKEVVRITVEAEPQARLQLSTVRRAPTLPPGSTSKAPSRPGGLDSETDRGS